MGILKFIKSQLIDIIEWLDNTNYTLVYKFPDEDHEVKNGAKLICRENQAAILINEGQLADIFGPGTHTLSTQNVPVLSRLKGWKYGFSSPFKVDVYFVNLRQFLNEKWGTPAPVLIRDPEFGVAGRPGRVRIRAFGTYNFRIIDPGVFFREIVGTQHLTTSEEITGYLKRTLVSKFSDAAGSSQLSVADMAGNYGVLADAVRAQIADEFARVGIGLTNFVIENISLPPEVEKALDAASAQAARGVDNTLAWEGMQAMRDAAKNPSSGGVAGVGMGAGMGMGMGMGMGQMMAPMMQGMQPGYPQQYQQPPGYPPGYPPPPQGYPQQYQQHPGYPPQPGHPGQAPGQAPPPAAPAPDSLESRLLKLKAAFDAQLLTEEEYKAKRMALLDAF